ncbi:MAG TPA: (deoxy)nucleoside triphosphate pyrophosphohydrolase [Phycisphaerae bacterium]|nr:(deoxy)nucleoside triphosphate pyrophosphohydrolase [Phycisphaerae bacterium]
MPDPSPAPSSLARPAPVEVAIAIVFDAAHRRVLICKRKPDTVLGGYWEFPGGKCNPGETPAACACREVLEETAITVRPVRELAVIEHQYPHARVRLHPFVCQYVTGDLQLLAVADAQWIDPAETPRYRFPEANLRLVRAVAAGFDAVNALPAANESPTNAPR